MSDWGPAACQSQPARLCSSNQTGKEQEAIAGRLRDGQARGREWVPSETLRRPGSLRHCLLPIAHSLAVS